MGGIAKETVQGGGAWTPWGAGAQRCPLRASSPFQECFQSPGLAQWDPAQHGASQRREGESEVSQGLSLFRQRKRKVPRCSETSSARLALVFRVSEDFWQKLHGSLRVLQGLGSGVQHPRVGCPSPTKNLLGARPSLGIHRRWRTWGSLWLCSSWPPWVL